LMKGIKTKLLTLPPETIVHPGHGPDSTIATEKRANPFLR
jgi:hydroxyacylglutathione hydrolase